jgi:glucose-1-phosphate thymidylyltransferase
VDAVIPAAGRGTRLRPLTDDRPKPLVEVAGEPLLAHALRALEPLAPGRVVVVTGHLGERIRGRFGDRWEGGARRRGAEGDGRRRSRPGNGAGAGFELTYVRQPNASGLAHALLAAEPKLRGDFAVLYGDNVVCADLASPVERFRERGLDALVVTEEVPPERARQGVCLTAPDGTLARIVEHPTDDQRRAGRVVTGFSVFSPRVLDACRRVEPSEGGEYELTDAVNVLLDREDARVEAVPLDGWRVNVNTPEDLERAERRLAG